MRDDALARWCSSGGSGGVVSKTTAHTHTNTAPRAHKVPANAERRKFEWFEIGWGWGVGGVGGGQTHTGRE